MRHRTWAVLVWVLLAASACGEGEPRGNDPVPRSSSGSDLTEWPDVDTANMDCAVDYPRDLPEREIAFDGTVEAVKVGEYDDDAGASPARMEVRVHEVFRGDIDGFVVMRTWDFMLPDADLRGTRILAAAGHSLDLMGCGFTRPYSAKDARLWRDTFSGLPPEDCGEEVLDCDLGELQPVPASCRRLSYEYAIHSNIDAGSYPFELIGCNEHYMSLRVDLGADACPPEASKEQRKRCERMKTAYFAADGDRWRLLTYEGETSCTSVQKLEPSFPDALCRP